MQMDIRKTEKNEREFLRIDDWINPNSARDWKAELNKSVNNWND